MKLRPLLLLHLLRVHSLEWKHKNYSQLTAALSIITDEVIAVDGLVPHIISSESLPLQDFTGEFLSKIFATSKIQIRHHSSAKLPTRYGVRKRCAVFLLDSFKEFLSVYEKLSSSVFKFNGLYLIVLVNSEVSEIQEIFKLLWKIQIYNVNIMNESEKGAIEVKTFIPFNPTNCNDSTPVLVNEFKNGKFANGVEGFFLDKMKNLHECAVSVSIANNSKPFIMVQRSPNGSHTLDGQDISLLRTLAESLNFRINFTFIGFEGFLYENGSSQGPFKALMDGRAELSLAHWWLKGYRLNFFAATTPYTIEPIIFVIPPGREFSSIDKLIFPFSLMLWMSIFACFLVGFFVIFITQRQSRTVQSFVFGSNVKHPYLNMFIGFIGGTQKILPRTSFARFLLMVFLMSTLVIRSLYQGSFYKLMQSNKRHREVQSIDEMIEKDFNFLVIPAHADVFQGTEVISDRFEKHSHGSVHTLSTKIK